MIETQTIDGLPGLAFDTSYGRLPERFYANVPAKEATAPRLIKLNESLAAELGLDLAAARHDELARILSGNGLPGEGTLLAMAYSGHQFGHFNPQLGDGRAGLIGEVIDPAGNRFDIQLKGSGPTPFSRSGDGLAALGPVLREYIVSEAMAALGVPTTRSLAAVLTGDHVYRDRILPGAVLTRVASSHLRIGTFQYFAARGDREAVEALADYAIDRHYPDLAENENPPLALLERVIDRQAALVAKWMGLGFIHGVMNTDNMTISGETIDYGPCAFMDHYDHNKVYSSIDQQGRYAYGAQPQIAQWNLARLAETLVPLIAEDEDKAIDLATKAIHTFPDRFTSAWAEVMAAKFGFAEMGETQKESIRTFLTLLQKHGVDFTNAFATLTKSVSEDFTSGDLTCMFKGDGQFDDWFVSWKKMVEAGNPDLSLEKMRNSNPVYIPRNHLVEEVIRAGEDRQDFEPLEALLKAVLQPFAERPGLERYAVPPEPEQEVLQTFCGT